MLLRKEIKSMVSENHNNDRRSGAKIRTTVKRQRPTPAVDCGPLRNSVGFFVLRANRILSRNWTGSALNQSMHLICYCTFTLIGANPGISLVEIAQYITVDKSRVSELVDLMEKKRLVVRRRLSIDHRKLGIYLTPAGIARLEIIVKEVEVQERRIQELYTAAERSRLISLLTRIER
jgi:DNA-binding MarR family transcriptional regulator